MTMGRTEKKNQPNLDTCIEMPPKNRKGINKALVAVAIIFLHLALLTIPASACGSCEEHHPWIHEQPQEKEIIASINTFINDLYESPLYKDNGNLNVVEIWYFEIYTPGYEEQYDIFEYILCFGIQDDETGRDKVAYYYTTLTHEEDKALYFHSKPLGPYSSRDVLNNYLESFIIRKPLENDLIKTVEVEASVLTSLRPQKNNWLSNPVIIAAFLAFIAINITVYKFKTLKKSQVDGD